MNDTPPTDNVDDDVDQLVDTNIVSFTLSNDPGYRALAEAYERQLAGRRTAIAFQTFAELLVGFETQGWDRRRFEQAMNRFRLIPCTAELIPIHVRLRAESIRRSRARRGRTLGAADAWIAATARRLNIPLITHDRALSQVPEITVVTLLPNAR